MTHRFMSPFSIRSRAPTNSRVLQLDPLAYYFLRQDPQAGEAIMQRVGRQTSGLSSQPDERILMRMMAEVD
jgi:hypothetical protein